MLLFVATTHGATLDDQLRDRIRAALRRELSPRHVPDAIEQVPAIPRTMTGKKLEKPIKQILLGKPASEVDQRRRRHRLRRDRRVPRLREADLTATS